MSVAPAMTPAVPAMTTQDLELKHVELLTSTAKFRKRGRGFRAGTGTLLETHGSFVSRR
jgi:hypothetical protein